MNSDLKAALASKHAQQKKQSASEEALREVDEEATVPGLTFLSLRRRLQRLMIHAVDSETDPKGMQFLLSGLGTMLQDAVSFENEVRKKQRVASEQRKDSEPCLDTGIVKSEDIEILVSEDQLKGEGQLEKGRVVPEVIVTRGSVTQDERGSEVLFRGVRVLSDTESLLEEGFSESGSVGAVHSTSVQCTACRMCTSLSMLIASLSKLIASSSVCIVLSSMLIASPFMLI